MDALTTYLVGVIRAYDDAGRLMLKACDGKIDINEALDIVNATRDAAEETLHYRMFDEIDEQLYGD